MFELSVFPSPASRRWEETEVVPIFSPARKALAHRRRRNRTLRPERRRPARNHFRRGKAGEP